MSALDLQNVANLLWGFAVLRYDKRSCAPLNGHPSCYDNTGAMDTASLRIEDFRDDAQK